jgi:hypothetical protein
MTTNVSKEDYMSIEEGADISVVVVAGNRERG